MSQHWPTWIACRDRWLRRLKSSNTRRMYGGAWEAFFTWSQAEPWSVTLDLAEDWRAHLVAEGMAPATVNARLAALQSFYFHATDAELWPRSNPFRNLKRQRHVAPVAQPVLTSEDVSRLLGVLKSSTLRGRRDRALLLGLLAIPWSAEAWVNIRWGQLRRTGSGWWVAERPGRSPAVPMPEAVIAAIVDWKDCLDCGRIGDDEHVFIAFEPGRAARLPGIETPAAGQPLSMSTVSGIVRALARKAGLGDRVGLRVLRRASLPRGGGWQ